MNRAVPFFDLYVEKSSMKQSYTSPRFYCYLHVSRKSKPSPAITPTANAVGQYDGIWTGTGNDTSKGKEFEISFSVRDSRITDIRYSFNGKDNVPCINLDYISLNAAVQPQVTESPFSISLGEDLSTSVAFDRWPCVWRPVVGLA